MSAHNPIAIFGTGEHALTVADIAREERYNVLGCIGPISPVLGLDWLGTEDVVSDLCKQYNTIQFILGIGNIPTRVTLSQKWKDLTWITIIASSAYISPTAKIANGVFIGPMAVVNSHVIINNHVIINSGAIVEHTSVINEFTNIGPGVVTGGGVVMGEQCFIGMGAHIRDHIVLGDGVTVAMGSVVIHSVPEHTRVKGVPACEF